MKSLREVELIFTPREGRTYKRKNHPIPLPTSSASLSGLSSPPSAGAERKLHPEGALHSTMALAPSYDLNSGSDASGLHNRLRIKACGVGSSVVDEGYEG